MSDLTLLSLVEVLVQVIDDHSHTLVSYEFPLLAEVVDVNMRPTSFSFYL